MAGRAPRAQAQTPVEELIAALGIDQLREVVSAADLPRTQRRRRRARRVAGRADAARATLQRADVRAFVDAVLGDGESELAWSTATAAPQDALGSDEWLRLAESRERDHRS